MSTVTVFEVSDEHTYRFHATAGTLREARDIIRRHGRGLCDDAGHVYTRPAGLSRSYDYIVLRGDHDGDVSIVVDGCLDYDRWDQLPRVERWQCGRHNNRTFCRRVGRYEGAAMIDALAS